jgi:hypothetical protein
MDPTGQTSPMGWPEPPGGGPHPEPWRYGPALTGPAGSASRAAGAADGGRAARLRALYRRWDEFAVEYEHARAGNDQQHMTNVRGLMLLIKREIRRLGGETRDFPVGGRAHLGDV